MREKKKSQIMIMNMKVRMKEGQERVDGLCNLNGFAQQKHKVQSTNDRVIILAGSKMVMILAIASSLSFSFGRYCQSNVPSLQRVLQQSLTSCFPLISHGCRLSQFLLKDDMEFDSSLHDHDGNDDGDAAISTGAEHLLVDVTQVDPALLSSLEILEEIFLKLVQENLHDPILSLTHTNGLDHDGGGGISITALFLQSHAFLHALPSTGVLTLDIYKSRGKAWASESIVIENNAGNDANEELPKAQDSLIKLVPVIQSLFVSKESENDSNEQQQQPEQQPRVYWAIKDRGLDYETNKSDPSDSVDYRALYLGRRSFTHKELVSVVKTPFQTFEVYDLIDIRDAHQRTDRILFLDHVTQSSRLGLEAYHEALVHPALLSHPNPKRVAIVGGGEGATLREVLKHSSVEKVIMIEIDAVMVNASKTALLEWNDCSDLVGSVGSCFDDPRAEVYLEDAVGWFLNRFNNKNDIPEEEKFDVIIMDALDPSSLVDFSDALYGNLALTQSMRNSLTDQGILIAQVGNADEHDDPGHEHDAEVGAASKMQQLLEEAGFEYSFDYSEVHCGFLAPWAFLISFLDKEHTVARWYSNPATFDLELSKRAISTISGDFPFKYIDGATMATYQYPSRTDQNVHCRSYPNSPGCHTVEYRTLEPLPRLSSPEMPMLKNGTYASFQESFQSLSIMPTTAKYITTTLSDDSVAKSLWKPIEAAIESLGFGHGFFGTTGYMVNPFLVRSNVTSRPNDDDGTVTNGASSSSCSLHVENNNATQYRLGSFNQPTSLTLRNQYLFLASVNRGDAAADVHAECNE